MTLYPIGYGTRLVTLDQLRGTHEPSMHPEFARRLFAWIESEGGRIGIGGGLRTVQPTKPGFAPEGQSFHQLQRFASGRFAYAAVDAVHVVPGQKHRAPTWREVEGAPVFGVHAFITKPPEPWHIQCVEMRGFQAWVNAGRPDPQRFALPGDKPPTTPDPEEDDVPTLAYYALPPQGTPGNPPHFVVVDGAVRYRTNGDTAPWPEIRLPLEQYEKLRLSVGL